MNRKAVTFFAFALMLSLGAAPLCAQTYEQKIDAAIQKVKTTDAKGRFSPDWPSLENYQIPQWYKDAKFGIFIHWGVYSVPAFNNEWYSRNMYQVDSPEFKHHIATYGPQSKFGYKDFIPLFKAEKFDPNHWAEVFRRAGAKYVVPVAEHHDGFAMYDNSYGKWNAATMGPKRDVIGLLEKAVRKRGLYFGVSSHRAEHYWFFNGGRQFPSDVQDPQYAGLYGDAAPQESAPSQEFLRDWLARSTELVDKYNPDLVYFDWFIGEKPEYVPYIQQFAAYYYDRAAERNKHVVLNYKNKAFPEKAAVLDVERGHFADIRPLHWQTDTAISWKSWCYVENDELKPPESLVQLLVDVVSKNGNLLLDIGPKADGTIPAEQEERLLAIGKWLDTNAEAIYATHPWKKFGEGPVQPTAGAFKEKDEKPYTPADIRFTMKDGILYAIALQSPADHKLLIRSLSSDSPLFSGKLDAVHLLGSKSQLKWARTPEGLAVDLPADFQSSYPAVIKLTGTGF
ncbi:MAG TPA: alpha-L-fucosidase [Terriglobales bacterium]|nr:alpha-L-fucosidase [Terriglobales bacterium]